MRSRAQRQRPPAARVVSVDVEVPVGYFDAYLRHPRVSAEFRAQAQRAHGNVPVRLVYPERPSP